MAKIEMNIKAVTGGVLGPWHLRHLFIQKWKNAKKNLTANGLLPAVLYMKLPKSCSVQLANRYRKLNKKAYRLIGSQCIFRI